MTSAEEKFWLQNVEEACSHGATGLIAGDFGYGALSHPRMVQASRIAGRKGAVLFGDTSTNRYASLARFENIYCDAIFPSEVEARAYLGQSNAGLPILASELFGHGMAEAVVLTMGARGLVLFFRSRRTEDVEGGDRYLPEYLPSLTPIAADVLGAGDALTTTASLARLVGASYVEAAVLGSIAAAVTVQRMDNDPLRMDTVMRALDALPIQDD